VDIPEIDKLIAAWEAAVEKYPHSHSCKDMLKQLKEQRERLLEREANRLIEDDIEDDVEAAAEAASEPEPIPEPETRPASNDPAKPWELSDFDKRLLRALKVKAEG
jgi:hypothetical protein